VEDQLNGGVFSEITEQDWNLIEPYLLENECHFGIPVDLLLTVDGLRRSPREVYRKVNAVPLSVLTQVPDTDDSVWSATSLPSPRVGGEAA
jgi:hypothetical protein